jgi:small GTP-binding protein
MLLGEIGVGKTSIARRLAFDKFDESYKATIGSDIYTYEIKSPEGVPRFRFYVWDTDGSFGSAILKHVYMRQAHAALVIGDATRPATLESMTKLAGLFEETLPGRYLALVVNKADLLEAGTELPNTKPLQDFGLPLRMTSAKTGENIRHTFEEAADTILRRDGLKPGGIGGEGAGA